MRRGARGAQCEEGVGGASETGAVSDWWSWETVSQLDIRY